MAYLHTRVHPATSSGDPCPAERLADHRCLIAGSVEAVAFTSMIGVCWIHSPESMAPAPFK
jgi:hypothetical protein